MYKINKINRDPFYSELYNKFSLEFIESAGYFDDYVTDSIVFDHFNYPFPTNHLYENYDNTKKCAILVTTGSFCPVHDGHIQMMIEAKKRVELEGFTVISGYISPDHNDYIFEKNKNEGILDHERIKLINDKVKNIDWLFSSPIGSIFSKGSVNFTEIVNYKKEYLKQRGIDVEVFFVCGGDNAHFAKTFMLKGNCVVVSRPGYKFNKIRLSRILYAECDMDISSTEVRKNNQYHHQTNKDLILRVEENDPRENFLIDIMNYYFNSITVLKTKDQQKMYSKLKSDMISLDSLFPLENNLEISRCYDTFGADFIKYTNRPGTEDLQSQANSIIKGNYSLIDDDIHTGGTMRFAKTILEKNDISIDSIMALTISKNGEEILDARDFLIGNENSGLVVRENGEEYRVPYIYPFINVFERCSINDPLQFSIDVWKMNMLYYENNKLRVKDLNLPYLKHFDDDMFIYWVCKYYVNTLENLK